MAPFVLVEIGPSVPARDVAEARSTTASARRRKSQGTSRWILVADTASESMVMLMETCYVEFSMPWCADDPGSDRSASVARDKLHRYAQRLSSLALQVQEVLHKEPLNGHLLVFRGSRSDLVRVI
ncbi:hypothetical protein J2R96_001970 [Bradyrhizobium elkanii]|nr:hypothetical protein [Bradyrhizobium elkanii]